MGRQVSTVVVDYGIGNVQSVVNAISRTHGRPEVVTSGDALLAAEPTRIVLPGVGAVGAALAHLRERSLDKALERLALDQKVPFLGICVGMQVLAEVCEEFGSFRGLGWIPGQVRHLHNHAPELPTPHVGWNEVVCKTDDAVLRTVHGKNVYFVHSYYLDGSSEVATAEADYGGPITVAVQRDNIWAVQFHPEKSSAVGEALLSAFLGAGETAAC